MAAWTNCFFPEVSPGKADDVASIKCIEPLLINIIGAIVSLAAVAFFVMLLVGGFNFLFSGGDPKKLEGAKNTLTYAVTGLVVIVAGYLILKTVEVFTGVNVTNFQIITN